LAQQEFRLQQPHGAWRLLRRRPGAVFAAILVVIFSMTGAEVATIAAAESHDPGRSIAKATNSVIGRIAVFYVGSVFLLVVILPWNSTHLAASPYVAAFEAMNIPGAADIMNAVVLTAVLSCLNSGLYTSSRMLFVLAARREAPVILMTVNGKGVPAWAIGASSAGMRRSVAVGSAADLWADCFLVHAADDRFGLSVPVMAPVTQPESPTALVRETNQA
jgi:L-asparagine transporter-like permease